MQIYGQLHIYKIYWEIQSEVFFPSNTMQTETQERAHKFKENGKHLASLVGVTAVAN